MGDMEVIEEGSAGDIDGIEDGYEESVGDNYVGEEGNEESVDDIDVGEEEGVDCIDNKEIVGDIHMTFDPAHTLDWHIVSNVS